MDLVTYALLSKRINSAQTGIKNIISNGTKLVFTLNDGNTFEVEIPQQSIKKYSTSSSLPAIGDEAFLYIVLDTKKTYIWNNNEYQELTTAQTEFENDLDAIYKALGGTSAEDIQTISEQIKSSAKDGIYRIDENGKEITISEVIFKLEEFIADLSPFPEGDISALFS